VLVDLRYGIGLGSGEKASAFLFFSFLSGTELSCSSRSLSSRPSGDLTAAAGLGWGLRFLPPSPHGRGYTDLN
jgi:hypothetical protein